MAERSRARHYASRRDYGSEQAPATYIVSQRKLTTFELLGTTARNVVISNAYTHLTAILAIVGGSIQSMDELFIVLFKRYSLCVPCQGVTLDMLFNSPLHMFEELGLLGALKRQIKDELRHSVSVEKLLVTFEEHGVAQNSARVLRRLYPQFFHSERQLSKCQLQLDTEAELLLGLVLPVENGFRLDFDKIFRAIYVWALSEAAHPEAMDETTTSTASILSSSQKNVKQKMLDCS